MNIAEIYWLGVATSLIYTMIRTWFAVRIAKAAPDLVGENNTLSNGIRRLLNSPISGGLRAFIITTAACMFSLLWFYFIPKKVFLAFKKSLDKKS